ncbi:MAG: DUF5011 domain-containing protein [bacterium]|nr:DUF5011 domain-containing protein [bacterium]
MKRLNIYLIAVLSISFLFGFTLNVQAAVGSPKTYVVTRTDDPIPGSCDIEDCSLREAISAANINNAFDDVITLSAGTYTLSMAGSGEDSNATGDLDILDVGNLLTINGAGAGTTIINANSIDRVLDVTPSAELEINDMTITGGNFASSGGGILSYGILTVNDSIIENNTATYGGGVASNTGTADINRTVITNNTASLHGGGISHDTSAGEFLTVTNSTISDNQAGASGIGGGIHTNWNIKVYNSTISGNTALHGGGIGTTCSATATSTITNTTITGNTATSDGGGIRNYCNAGSAWSNRFDISHSTISGNTAGSSGGGVFIQEGGLASASMYFNGSILNANIEGALVDENCSSSGTLISLDYNLESGTSCGFAQGHDLSNTDAQLDSGGLANNGGSINTIALQSTSPAVDAGICIDISSASVTTDQRGYARPENSVCDIGAYELDQTAPVVTVTGSSTLTHECATTYSDAGASGSDNWDTSVNVGVDSSALDVFVPGNYAINYSATDNDNNEGTASRTVTVSDTIDPTLTVSGADVTVAEGDTYTDAGATASDTCDDSVAVTTNNPVDTSTPGTYTVTYTATDDSNNTDTGTRTVTVTPADPGAITDATKSGGDITITYEDASTQTISPFNGRKNFRHQLSVDAERLIVSNGKVVRVYVDGVKVSQKRIAKNKPENRTHYRMKVKKILFCKSI